jgi:type II secretory pathway component PulF
MHLSRPKFADWCSHLSDAIDAGLDLSTILKPGNKFVGGYKKFNKKIHANIEKGMPLYRSIPLNKRSYPQHYQGIIKAGEDSGEISSALRNLAEYIQFQHQIASEIKETIINLLFKITALVLFLGGSLVLIDFVGKGRADLLGVGLSGIDGAVFMIVTWLKLLLIIGVSYWVFNQIKSNIIFEFIFLKLPVIGSCLMSYLMYRLTMTMHFVLAAGINVNEMLDLSYKSASNKYFVLGLRKIKKKLSQGQGLHQSMSGHRLLPERFLSTLRYAEMSGHLPKSLGRLSGQYKTDVQKRLGKIIGHVKFLTKAAIFTICIATIGMIVNSLAIQPLIKVFSKF